MWIDQLGRIQNVKLEENLYLLKSSLLLIWEYINQLLCFINMKH